MSVLLPVQPLPLPLPLPLLPTDNANDYFTAQYVGAAMAESGLTRSQIFLTTKVGSQLPMGYADTKSQVRVCCVRSRGDTCACVRVSFAPCAVCGRCAAVDPPFAPSRACACVFVLWVCLCLWVCGEEAGVGGGGAFPRVWCLPTACVPSPDFPPVHGCCQIVDVLSVTNVTYADLILMHWPTSPAPSQEAACNQGAQVGCAVLHVAHPHPGFTRACLRCPMHCAPACCGTSAVRHPLPLHGVRAVRAYARARPQPPPLAHRPPPTAHPPIQYNATQCRLDSWKAMVEAFNGGLTKAIGVANYDRAQLEEIAAAGYPLPAVNQIPLHLYRSSSQVQAASRARARAAKRTMHRSCMCRAPPFFPGSRHGNHGMRFRVVRVATVCCSRARPCASPRCSAPPPRECDPARGQADTVAYCHANNIVVNAYSPLGIPDWHAFPTR
jgi:diketogulonate reductase-like aldo/keto reductase